jgi:spore coat polysaccharide biosynthesis protein SpsF
MNILTVIQARMSSSRLPGKVMLPLASEPLLLRMAQRVTASKKKGLVLIATTTGSEDDVIEALCNKENILCFRGSKDDLLDRHYQAGMLYKADVVVKIPSDCPLIDPEIIDEVIGFYLRKKSSFDYVSNLHPPSFPDGNDVEVMSINALKVAWLGARKQYEREHTTPYFWENPEIFRLGNYTWKTKLDYSASHRWTIDYQEDYQLIAAVFDHLHTSGKIFTMRDILALLEELPHIADINRIYNGVNWYRHYMSELKTIYNIY